MNKSKSSITINKKSLLIFLSALTIVLLLAYIGGIWLGQRSNYQKQLDYSYLRIRELDQRIKELSQNQEQALESKYLEVQELGIKVKLVKEIEDAYYKIENIPSEGTPSLFLVHISTNKAQKLNDQCSAENGGLMTISLSDRTSYYQQIEYGSANVRKIGEKYIRIENALGSCNNNNSSQITGILNSLHNTDLLPI